MTSHPGIRSNHTGLETALLQWLDESCMPLPSQLTLGLEVAESLPPLEAAGEVYRQGFLEIRLGNSDRPLQVEWPGHAIARIAPLGPEAGVIMTRKAAEATEPLFRVFLLVVFIFLWKRVHRFHVHAGTARDPEGRGWMLIGNAHSGKSTTMALLARRGWRVGTDDAAFLVEQEGRVAAIGFRDRIALRPGGLDLLGCTGGVALPRRQKTAFTVEEMGGRWIQTIEPEIVLFAEGTGESTRLTPAEPREILNRLIQNSPWVMFEADGATEYLDLLARLGRQARCYKATLGPDIFEHPDALMGFLP